MVAVPMETDDAPVGNGSGKSVANPSVLPLFGQLSNLNPAKRVEAAANLVKILRDSTEADLDYTVTRLVKGLAANKGWSRPGFTVGLISVLKNCEIEFQTVIDKMNEVRLSDYCYLVLKLTNFSFSTRVQILEIHKRVSC